MNNSHLLGLTTRESDGVTCEKCNKGIFIPKYPDSEVNHSFKCSNCGAIAHIEASVSVE